MSAPTSRVKMEYEVAEDKLFPGDWRVEATDYESDGECYVVIFSGPHAKERAEEYADFKNSQKV